MSSPKYVARFARLPQVFEVLSSRTQGMALTELAERVGAPVEELREDLLAFYTADVAPFGLTRMETLEFIGAAAEHEPDPNEADMVRLVDPRAAEEIGVTYVDAGELALLYQSALLLADVEGNDRHLAGALRVLARTAFGEDGPESMSGTGRTPWAGGDERPGHEFLAVLRAAVADRTRVRLTYSRSWHSGVTSRVIEPYRLLRTNRGWEVDAGPPDERGALRTFLVGNIRDARPSGGAAPEGGSGAGSTAGAAPVPFDPPPDLDALLAAQRITTTVRVELPQSARWAADMYAETVRVITDDELSAVLDTELLPPLAHRVGLMLLAAGPGAQVLQPDTLRTARADLATQLLAHHTTA